MASYFLAYWLRLDSIQAEGYLPTLLKTWPLVVGVSLIVFKFGGIYSQIWHLAHIQSAMTIVRCVVAASMIAWLSCVVLQIDPVVPRTIFPIFCMLTIILVGAARFTYRQLVKLRTRKTRSATDQERVVIYGAGVAGDLLARHIASNHRFPFRAIGFVDDDMAKRGRRVHGLRILGSGSELGRICRESDVKTILIAMHAAPGKTLRRIVETCQEHGIKPLIMPDLANSFGEEVFRPRSIDIPDLLRRSPKLLDKATTRSFFEGKTILITGAGGSIGSEICRQVLDFKPARMVMLDASEFNLYTIEEEIEKLGKGSKVQRHYVLGSVADANLVDRVFDTYRPALVLHAAAYKHVPIIESNPLQGVLNNVQGTRLLAEAAIRYGTFRFLLISTDKAVRPTSIMGATKRCCELLLQAMHALHRNSTGFCAVRFGNVLGSSGSVIPRFLQQIQTGGPITVTHPDMTRYFMLVSEAVSLVLQAISMSNGGEIFVLDMGEPVKIFDMAKQLIRLAGKEPGRDIEIVVTGVRPGEKLYEELILETSECQQLVDDLYIATPEPVDGSTILKDIDEMIVLATDNLEASCIQRLRHVTRWTDPAIAQDALDDAATSVSNELH